VHGETAGTHPGGRQQAGRKRQTQCNGRPENCTRADPRNGRQPQAERQAETKAGRQAERCRNGENGEIPTAGGRQNGRCRQNGRPRQVEHCRKFQQNAERRRRAAGEIQSSRQKPQWQKRQAGRQVPAENSRNDPAETVNENETQNLQHPQAGRTGRQAERSSGRTAGRNGERIQNAALWQAVTVQAGGVNASENCAGRQNAGRQNA